MPREASEIAWPTSEEVKPSAAALVRSTSTLSTGRWSVRSFRTSVSPSTASNVDCTWVVAERSVRSSGAVTVTVMSLVVPG